jgi:signal transduction histidine kinase
MPPDEISKRKFDFRRGEYWSVEGSDRQRPPECGEFYLKISFWYRTTPWIDGADADMFTGYLDQFGGISVYRDGLNIFPAEWGAITDWLRLSKRHIKKGSNLSYYAMIGALELDQSKNLNIIDKTDRQGMLENVAFRDLSELVRDVILYIENIYTGKRDQFARLTKGVLREPRRLADISKQSAQVLERLKKEYDFSKDPFGLMPDVASGPDRRERIVNLEASLRSLQKSLGAMQDVQELLTEQAGFGLAIAVSVHEIAKLTANFYTGVTELLKQESLDRPKLEELRDASDALKSELRRLGPLRAIRNEQPIEFPVSKSIQFVASVHERQMGKYGIKPLIQQGGDFTVLARYGALNQVINNLVDNSCYWLRRVPRSERSLLIEINPEDRTVLVADNGPDIDESIRPYLFQPGYSLRVPPSGLGLYVCKYYMQSMGGDIYEVPLKRRREGFKGAQFILDFARIPEKKGL